MCAALTSLAGLTACDNPNLSETFAKIKTADVDAGTGEPAADPKKLHPKDIELAVTTVKDLAISVDKATKAPSQDRLQIAVVDPLDMPNAAPADEPAPVAVEPPKPETPKPETPTGRSVQIGSFGSMAAAKDAWLTLQAKYPGVERYNPSYQSVTTAAGKSVVRLKVGPVTTQAQAAALCGQLGVRDAWCAKAS
ncbi:sporulation related domain protein [Asticcacaulis biprosthecium C19]|uniref:Sporulation related domain protein n=1 Tax=Asticcacaulis biprosthecium C19 TaxID=715226 RepID=F4QRL8_9CAUL|nr:sporulation related domain protein [Asticcacaulis biprosthecium C19]